MKASNTNLHRWYTKYLICGKEIIIGPAVSEWTPKCGKQRGAHHNINAGALIPEGEKETYKNCYRTQTSCIVVAYWKENHIWHHSFVCSCRNVSKIGSPKTASHHQGLLQGRKKAFLNASSSEAQGSKTSMGSSSYTHFGLTSFNPRINHFPVAGMNIVQKTYTTGIKRLPTLENSHSHF
jgi:hypothetical protein